MKSLTTVGLGLVLVFGGAASCNDREPRPYYPVEIPDCDADDKIGKWDTEDCGPSPAASKKSSTPRRTPAPRRTR